MKKVATAIAAAVALTTPALAKTTILKEVRTPTRAYQYALLDGWDRNGFNFGAYGLGPGVFKWGYSVFNGGEQLGRAAVYSDSFNDAYNCSPDYYSPTRYSGECYAPEGYHFDNITVFFNSPQHGTIVYSWVYNVYYETSVPEPASWALMIAGLGLVGLAARMRQGASIDRDHNRLPPSIVWR